MGGLRLRRLLVAAGLGSAVLAGMAPGPARAQAPPTVGIRILDAPSNRTDDPRARLYIVDHLTPRTTIRRRVEVANNTATVQPVQIYAAAGDISGGMFHFGAGRAVNELTTWTSVDPPSLSVPAGARAVATVTIAVPAGAGPGERYGVVWAELAAAAPPGGGIAAVNRVGVRIYLSVGEGAEPATDFVITALEAGRDADGRPTVSATVRNSGGRALDLSGELRLTGGPGGLSAGPFDARLGTTLGVGQTEPVLVGLDRAVPAGPWDARIALHSGTTSREAGARITFPAAPASSAGPVRTAAGGGGGGRVALAAASAVVAAVVAVGFLLARRRRRPAAGGG